MVRQHVVEGMGVFFLMLALMFNHLALGFMLMAMIYIGGHVSGGHFNPAFSLAAWMKRWVSLERMFTYMIAQVAGAFLAALYYYHASGQVFKLMDLPAEAAIFKMMVPEALMTFVFVSVFLAANAASALREAGLNGLVIGLTLIMLTLLGGVFNPALAGGAMLGNMMMGVMPAMHAVLVQLVSPLIGGAAAVLVYNFINNAE